jgi:FlaG/FlaF family flagellin (archaellin)
MTQSRDRAVSHVVAVALLVAIVTLLAATTAVSVGSFGDAAGEPVPNTVLRTAFEDRASPNGQYLNISHEGGETLETDALRLDVDGARTRNPSGAAVVESDVIAGQLGDEWTATETLSLNRSTFDDASGADLTGPTTVALENAAVRLTFERSETESTILYECEVASPDCSNREA